MKKKIAKAVVGLVQKISIWIAKNLSCSGCSSSRTSLEKKNSIELIVLCYPELGNHLKCIFFIMKHCPEIKEWTGEKKHINKKNRIIVG